MRLMAHTSGIRSGLSPLLSTPSYETGTDIAALCPCFVLLTILTHLLQQQPQW